MRSFWAFLTSVVLSVAAGRQSAHPQEVKPGKFTQPDRILKIDEPAQPVPDKSK
jgi:hypothetical protein